VGRTVIFEDGEFTGCEILHGNAAARRQRGYD